MKICYIADSIIPSRAANSIHVMKMCQAYASLGHDVCLIVPKWKKGVESSVNDLHGFYGVRKNFKIIQVPIPRWRISRFYWSFLLPLIGALRRPDVVHTRSIGVAWGLTCLFALPTIYELHVPPPPDGKGYKSYLKMVGQKSLKSIVCITMALSNVIRQQIPAGLPIVIAPDGVDRNLVEDSIDKFEARAKIGCRNETRPIIAYTGGLYKGRGIDLIVALAKELADCLFLVVGGSKTDIMRIREETGHIENLKFVGFVPPYMVPFYINAADALLLPHGNKVEALGGGDITQYCSPIKMFEYMASGRPIVASTLPVLQEVLQDQSNALLIPFESVSKWVNALRQLLSDGSFAQRLGNKARADVKRYTWESRAKYILNSLAG